MAGGLRIFRDSKGEYRFRLRSRNGNVAGGGSYPTKAGLVRGIQAVRRRRREDRQRGD